MVRKARGKAKESVSQHRKSFQRQGKWSIVLEVGSPLPSPLSALSGAPGGWASRAHPRPPESHILQGSSKGLGVGEPGERRREKGDVPWDS